MAEYCGSNPESIIFVGNANGGGLQGFDNTYNPNWHNHPNFSWGVISNIKDHLNTDHKVVDSSTISKHSSPQS